MVIDRVTINREDLFIVILKFLTKNKKEALRENVELFYNI